LASVSHQRTMSVMARSVSAQKVLARQLAAVIAHR